jgi:hypothetical protein
MTKMLAAAGVTPPTRAAPGWLVRAIAYVGETAYRALGIEAKPPLTRIAANIMSRDCILVDAKARKEMGYTPPFTIEQGLEALRSALT